MSDPRASDAYEAYDADGSDGADDTEGATQRLPVIESGSTPVPDRPGVPDRTGASGQSDDLDGPDDTDRSGAPDRSGVSDRTGASDRPDSSGQSDDLGGRDDADRSDDLAGRGGAYRSGAPDRPADPDRSDDVDRSASASAYQPLPTLSGDDGKAGRFWSARRVPAAIAALLVLGGSGLLLYDIVAVRADHPAMRWRRELARQLGERPLDDTAVLVGAAVAAVLGLWLLLLAVTPGMRSILPMRRTHADVRGGLYRGAAATVLRDRAMDVPGVQSVRVRMTRSKVAVRAVSHFRELDDVRGDLDATLSDGIRDLGLARDPGLSVHVARPGRKG